MRHHNCLYKSSLGCSPLFAASGVVPKLLVECELGKLELKETKQSAQEEDSCKQHMKRNFDRRCKSEILLVKKSIGA